jgi:proline racemase
VHRCSGKNLPRSGLTWQAACVLPSFVAATDYHTGGEPFQIVADPPVAIPGRTVAERRVRATQTAPSLWGCGRWKPARVQAPESGSVVVVIDVPSGRTGRVHRVRGRVVAVDFVNVASWLVARDVPATPPRGHFTATVAYGGAIYATVPAARLGLAVTPAHLGDLIAPGREIRWALNDSDVAVHPTDPRLNGIYGTIWFDDLGGEDRHLHQRNVTVFADGEVDRSPCGSGTCARLAVLAADGRLTTGATMRHESIVGSTFTGTVLESVAVDGRPAVIAQVTGNAYRTGEHEFCIDPHDPLVPGFVLR